ncbi:MAG TPA: L-seryl-tRNA(Sec) selenium transferase, partial [Thermodesulfobacteriota bacterium]|nr:L-seryl-tRNA(Sec) selenium transferase [Thermodesulfobacteriota bacterium]
MEAKVQNTILRSIPSVTELLQHSAIQDVLGIFPRQLVLAAIRNELESLRSEILSNNAPFPSSPDGDLTTIVSRIRAHLQKASGFSLQKVINATGIVIHTNLGRAPLPPQVLENLAEVAEGYCTLEYDLEKGERGSRYRHVEETLLDLTGAESGLVVNNNAAAVLIVLNTVAQGREVIVSRGELIEIGGSFRLPDVMRQSGCLLKEVGATNRTRISDYEEALTSQTGLLMSVHPSNFRIVGFTEQVGLRELVALGRKHGIPVMNDLGSGTLVD